MTKKIKVIVSVLVLLLLIGGCGKKKESTKTSDGKTKLEMWTFVEQHAKFFNDAATSWNKENPDEQIELKTNVLAYDQMHQKLQVALTSGSGAPDISDIEIGKFSSMTKGNKVPLESFNDEIADIKDVLVTSRLDNFTVDGNVLGLDYHVGSSVVFYNMEIMDEAGINPDDIKTWADFEAAGKVVKEKTGKPITDLNTTNATQYYLMVTQQHSDIIQEGKSDLANEASVRALDYLQGLIYDSKVAGKSAGGFNDTEEFFPTFNEGQSAAVVYPIWYMSRMVDYMPDLSGKIKITPLPIFNEGDDRSAGIGGTATVVTNQASNKELAKKFIVYAKASKEGAINIWNELGFDPIRTDVWESDELRAENKFTNYFGTNIFDVLAEVSDEIGTISWTDPLYATVSDKIGTDVFPNTLEENNETPKEALAKVDKAVNAK